MFENRPGNLRIGQTISIFLNWLLVRNNPGSTGPRDPNKWEMWDPFYTTDGDLERDYAIFLKEMEGRVVMPES